MSVPDLPRPISYDEILQANIAKAREMLPEWVPADGDNVMLVLRAFSYREMLLREEFDAITRGLFLSTATGPYLDNLAETLYGEYRLPGAKPTATMVFSTTAPLGYDLTIPAGYELVDEGGIYHAKLMHDVTIKAGAENATGTIELQTETATSKAKTEIQVSPMPFVQVKQTSEFAWGSDPEDDEKFRERIRVSLSDKSTAGARNTYISYTLSADERIEDVYVHSPTPGVVRVVYWAPEMDTVMQERVEAALSADDVRPLTDDVQIVAATEIPVDITATLIIERGRDASKIVAEATERVQAGAISPQIGQDVSLSRIISLLMVPGVLDVQLAAPTGNLTVGNESIAVLGTLSINYEVTGDEY